MSTVKMPLSGAEWLLACLRSTWLMTASVPLSPAADDSVRSERKRWSTVVTCVYCNIRLLKTDKPQLNRVQNEVKESTRNTITRHVSS